MARITVLGGTGYAGAHIVAEAAGRGHEVTSWSRHEPAQPVEGVTYRTGSALEDGTLAAVVEGADVVVETLSPRGELVGKVRELAGQLADLAQQAGVRLGVVGGAGSLLVEAGGPRLVDTDAFAEEYRPEALQLAGVLDDLRAREDSLDWFFVSPAVEFGPWADGPRTGAYRTGDDLVVADADGRSTISGSDFAVAFVDEIEAPKHSRRRFTVAY
ncbi:NAD(P)-dependent oxidoreductase [Propionicimonas sp.]|uniref:NAD(P)-dependent oxidoreductase n=1 Tax=Propionicimonas sp. TaxID=1955623 RepID=UPI0039E3A1E3